MPARYSARNIGSAICSMACMLCFFDPRQDVSERPYTLEATPPERMVGEPVP